MSPNTIRRQKPRRLPRPPTSSLLALALIATFAAPAHSQAPRHSEARGESRPSPQVIVEISADARRLLNSRDTGRLIRLELAEVRVTPHPTRHAEQGLTLFYRVLTTDTGELRIELWERGEFYGARRVSTAHGDKKLLARHVALATAELAQRLSRAHSQRAKQLERERIELLAQERAREERTRRERWALVSGVHAAWLPRTRAWLAGPRLGFQLNHPRNGRLELTGGWFLGSPGALPRDVNLEWLELRLEPSYRFDAAELDLGFDIAAATALFTGPVWLEGMERQRQTWSARAGAHVGYQPRVSQRLRLDVGADASVLLRNVWLEPSGSPPIDLGGLWLGLTLGVLVDS